MKTMNDAAKIHAALFALAVALWDGDVAALPSLRAAAKAALAPVAAGEGSRAEKAEWHMSIVDILNNHDAFDTAESWNPA